MFIAHHKHEDKWIIVESFQLHNGEPMWVGTPDKLVRIDTVDLYRADEFDKSEPNKFKKEPVTIEEIIKHYTNE